MTGTVLDIQRLSTEDGPGLRTTVFLKGCSLRCAWCHNPESIHFLPQVQWIEAGRCIGCGLCVEACPLGGLVLTEAGLEIDRDRCEACGGCVNICPTGALERKGEQWEARALVHEVSKDRSFFGADGGVTFSGGEALMQAEFVAEAIELLRRSGIHTAVDTAGLVPREALERVLPLCDLMLYDLKLIDSEEHRRLTGAGSSLILDNARVLAAHHRERGGPEIWVRTPIIPGATDTRENITGIGEFIEHNLAGCVSRWELCAFNNLCADKYGRLGMRWAYAAAEKIDADTMESLAKTARESGVDPEIVLWTGATQQGAPG